MLIYTLQNYMFLQAYKYLDYNTYEVLTYLKMSVFLTSSSKEY